MKISKVLYKVKDRYLKFKEYPLTKNAPWLAMFRYIKFNLMQQINNKERVYKWINGLQFYAKKGEAGIVPNIYFKLFDYEDSMFILNNLNPGELFVDIGANVGHFSMLAASKKAKVIAVEPIPDTFQRLQKNIALNRLENLVILKNIGVGDAEGKLFFTQNKDVMNSVATETDTNTLEVSITTLDALLQKEQPKIMKIDVEGYEYFVLQGAKNIFANPSLKAVIIELNDSSQKFQIDLNQIHAFIIEYGFVPAKYSVNDNLLTPMPTYNHIAFNTLYVRKELLEC